MSFPRPCKPDLNRTNPLEIAMQEEAYLMQQQAKNLEYRNKIEVVLGTILTQLPKQLNTSYAKFNYIVAPHGDRLALEKSLSKIYGIETRVGLIEDGENTQYFIRFGKTPTSSVRASPVNLKPFIG